MTPFLFYLLAGIIIIPAIAVVLSENLFHAGLSLIVSFLGIAGIYAMLAAPFVAGMQVLVYAGAIAVLLLFAFMLTHDIMKPLQTATRAQQASSMLVCLVLALAIGRVLISSGWNAVQRGASPPGGSIAELGSAFLTRFLVPFELVSVLLLMTLIGAVVIARKEERERSPQELLEASDSHQGQQP